METIVCCRNLLYNTLTTSLFKYLIFQCCIISEHMFYADETLPANYVTIKKLTQHALLNVRPPPNG